MLGLMDFPAGREAIISQFRVWPFLSTVIMTSGERNRNPGHHFAGISNITFSYLNDVLKFEYKKDNCKNLV
jgi:hypothetical protein